MNRRTLSGKLIPYDQPTPDPWAVSEYKPKPSQTAYRRAFDSLNGAELAAYHQGDVTRLDELATDEATRQPANARRRETVRLAADDRAARKQRRTKVRAGLAERRALDTYPTRRERIALERRRAALASEQQVAA